MSLRIVISKLPPQTTAEELGRVLAVQGIIAASISLNDEGNADQVTAILILKDLGRPTAGRLAERFDGTIYQGRRLHAYVPLFL
jgi:hypothetical protein